MYCIIVLLPLLVLPKFSAARRPVRDNQIRRLALNPRALRELLPNCWRVVAAMEKVLGSGRSNWNTNGSAVTAASGYRPSPSILNASLNTWYT